MYAGPFYSNHPVEGICPWCIASGEAARRYDGEFTDPAAVDPVDDPTDLDELLHRTPGYASWQQEEWRSHCGRPCAYLGPFGARVLRQRRGEVEADLREAGIPVSELGDYPDEVDPTGGMMDPELHLFECLVCGRARAAGYYS